MATNAPYRISIAAASLLAVGGQAWSAEANLQLEIPALNVAEYHKPYVAVWLEKPGESRAVAQVALWYDVKKPNNGGAKWLNDMRQWWRAGGRALALPVDGVTSATRPVGQHTVDLTAALNQAKLPAGAYEVVVEAAREGGGRAVQRLPLTLPISTASQAKAQGDGELGALRLEVKP